MLETLIHGVLSTMIYSFLGIFIMFTGFLVLENGAKFSIKKEILEDENIALGIIIGCFFIAIAIIIAASTVEFYPAPIPNYGETVIISD